MPHTDLSPRSAARLAGAGYVAIFVLAIYANFAVLSRIVVPDDAAATAQNLVESASEFRLALAAFTLVFLLDVVIAWALYVLFRPVDAQRSLLAAWFRIVYTVFLGAAVVFGAIALEIATSEAGSGSDAAVDLALTAFDITWLVGLSAFGVHLVLLGRMMLRGRVGPRWVAVILPIAGGAYIVDTLAHLVLADYAQYADAFLALVAIPSIVGELAFTVWLLARAGSAVERAPQAPALVDA